MALPPLRHPCWPRAASGALARLKTQHLGTQLMAKRLERSTDPVAQKAAEIHAYFVKWERTLGAEISQLAAI